MKSLVLKSLLVISVVTVTSVLAWAKLEQDPCTGPDWQSDVVCNSQDKMLGRGLNKVPASAEGNIGPNAGYCRQCEEAKMAAQARLQDATNPPYKSANNDPKPPPKNNNGRR